MTNAVKHHSTFKTWVIRLFALLVILSASLASFAAIPANQFTRAIGVTEKQENLIYLYRAAFWYARALSHTSTTEPAIQTIFGNLVGLDKEGRLVISTTQLDREGHLVPQSSEMDRFVRVPVHLADVRVSDPAAAAQLIHELVAKDVKFDVYAGSQVVAWVDGVPLNIRLIEAGAAEPDPNPPTNIVDIAFATYYWRKLYGNEND